MGLNDFRKDDPNNPSGPNVPPSPVFPQGPPVSGPPPYGAPFNTHKNAGGDVPEVLIDYNQQFKDAEPTAHRDTVIKQTTSVLISMNKPNPLLVGPAGVGKTKIVEDIARRLANNDALVPAQLKNYTLYELPLTALVAGTGVVGALEEAVTEIIDFASEPKNKVILFIDEIHQITGGSSSNTSGTLRKVSQMLKPALARGNMRLIGATTAVEARAFNDDPAFSRRFQHLIVDELTPEQTLDVLHGARKRLMEHYKYNVAISDSVLADTVRVADANASANQHRPDSALTLLDRAMADRVIEQRVLIAEAEKNGDTAMVTLLQNSGPMSLTRSRLVSVAQRLATGNAARPAASVSQIFDTLRKNICGQDEVLDILRDRLARVTLDIAPSKTPTTWLFAGASGVGKTETAKIISRELTNLDPILINMTEYNNPSSMAKLVGAPPGYVGSDSNAEFPFDCLKSNPFRVIVLDEFEKADESVKRLFLSAFDEGYVHNARGEMLNFSKAIFICTTNAGRDVLEQKQVGFTSPSTTSVSQQSISKALSESFPVELLGRFSLIAGFKPMTFEMFLDVMDTQYTLQRERIVAHASQWDNILPATMPHTESTRIAHEVFVAGHGARPAKRAVERWLQDQILNHTNNPLGLIGSPDAANANDENTDAAADLNDNNPADTTPRHNSDTADPRDNTGPITFVTPVTPITSTIDVSDRKHDLTNPMH